MARVGIVCDYAEEKWPSMDLCAEMLLTHLQGMSDAHLQSVRLQPVFRWRFGRLPGVRSKRWTYNTDRLINRFWDYPQYLRRRRESCDGYHLVDHSYSQLVKYLPFERTGVFCHDLDTFRCLLEPSGRTRPRWFRTMMRHVLEGLQKAAVVFHSTMVIRRQIEKHGLLDPGKLVHAPYGVAPEFNTEEVDSAESGFVPSNGPFMLHVGSCIPRKRIDVLLKVFAEVRRKYPELELVQVGGQWSCEQRQELKRLDIESSVRQLGGLNRQAIAVLYRRAAVVVQPSEAEGFGFPVIEALACGSLMIASDLPVLREVGGDAVVYCRVGDVPAWLEAVTRLLAQPETAPPLEQRLNQAKRFSWVEHARTIASAYSKLLEPDKAVPSG